MAFTAIKNENKKKICTACHTEKSLTKDFYISKSPMFSLDGRIPVCKSCLISCSLNEDGTINEVELNKILRQVDKPFYKDDLASGYAQFSKEHSYIEEKDVKYYGKEILSLYFKNIAMRQTINKNYCDSEKENFMHQNSNVPISEKKKIAEKYLDIKSSETKDDKQQLKDAKWSKKDKQNMNYVISTVGYDPFEDLGLNESDRKYCFNVMSGYCDTDGIKDDGHKRLACLQIVMSELQCKKFNELINMELLKSDPNETSIKNFTNAKTSLLSSIATLSKDNNISSAYNGSSKAGKNTLTQKMQDMFADGIESVKVNLFDIETCEYMKQIADCSNRSILEQLTLDTNEYTQMIKEQRGLIQFLQDELAKTKEGYRLLNNEMIELKKRR